MNCPLCGIESTQNHLRYCKKNINELPIKDLKKMYLVHNVPELFEYDNLIENYINKQMSLPDIKREFNISYATTLFMLNYYNIPTRSRSEAFKSCNKKRKQTNLQKYGAENVLGKDTIIYHKRNETMKSKYGVYNAFQIPEVIGKINDDNYYLEKYGMTLSELRKENALKFWESLEGEERKKFIELCNSNRRKTFDKNYGGHPLQTEDIQDKMKLTNLSKYEVEYIFKEKI